MRKINLLLITLVTMAWATARAQSQRPNIIVFLVDDLGWNDTSVPMADQKTKYNERYRTPNLEKMATQGVTFTRQYTNAICIASRVSLLTGQSMLRHQVTGDIEPSVNGRNTLYFPSGHTIQDRLDMLPAVLKRAGYFTALAGKYHACHMCPAGVSPTPDMAGFDVNIGGSGYGQPGSYYGLDSFQNAKAKDKQPYPGLEKYFGKDIFMTEALTRESLVFMKKAVDKKQPFFMYLAHYGVHTPIQPQKKFSKNYTLTPGEPADEAAYATMIEGVDESLGQLMKALDDWKIANNTLLIFMGDNGGRVLWRGSKSLYGPYDFNYPLKSGKAAMYEGGTRVPCVIRWPGKTKAGLRRNEPLMIEDVYATVLQAAGASANKNYPIDGKSWLPLLNGYANDFFSNRKMSFIMPYRFDGIEYNGPDFAFGGIEASMARIEGDWKLLYFMENERFELYNLKDDIGEKNNLIHQKPEMAWRMIKALDKDLHKKNVRILPLKLPDKKPALWPVQAWTKNKGGSDK